MPLTDHVALVSLTSDVSRRSFLQAAAAIQKQITRDFTPIWGLPATVDAFEDLASVPATITPSSSSATPTRSRNSCSSPSAGVRQDLIDDFEGSAVGTSPQRVHTPAVRAGRGVRQWSVTLSHEVLEMITDPFGNRLIAAAHPLDREQQVKYLLEVCDPCQTMWYPVNGVPVCGHLRPQVLRPGESRPEPLQLYRRARLAAEILEGGYLSGSILRTRSVPAGGAVNEPVRLADLAQLARSSAPLRTVVDTNGGHLN